MKTYVVIQRAAELWHVEVSDTDRPHARRLYDGSLDAMMRTAADCIASSTRAGELVAADVVILPLTASEWYSPGGTYRSTVAAPKPSTELTAIGEQFVIPGCERRETARGRRPTQRSLWGDK